jgi:hypothetical protein
VVCSGTPFFLSSIIRELSLKQHTIKSVEFEVLTAAKISSSVDSFLDIKVLEKQHTVLKYHLVAIGSSV